ncbi:polyketide synthase dehydratase domain-containing protein, partial [Dactylosporangium sp. NPDC000555]|uniref:polyketide synthase dehydratase domain-containing protein n=1 Tax=Dactylosporangium sp. NPDC000555 TaxID=3154260 RepID=UPI00332F6851
TLLAHTWTTGHTNHPTNPTNHLPQAPTYPFQHQSYWLTTGHAAGAATHPFLFSTAVHAPTNTTLWTGTLNPAVHTWLGDHVIDGTALLPAAALLEMCWYVGRALGTPYVRELVLQAPMTVPARGGLDVQVVAAEPDAEGGRTVTVLSRATGGSDAKQAWSVHATGVLGDEEPLLPTADLTEWPPQRSEPVDIDDLYDALADRGFDYGPAFHGLRRAWRRGDELFAEVATDGAAAGFELSPMLLDAALHVLHTGVAGDETMRLPWSWNDAVLWAPGADELRVHLTVGTDVELRIADRTGSPVAAVGALALRRFDRAALPASAPAGSLYRLEWNAVEPVTEPAAEKTVFAVIEPGDLFATTAQAHRVLVDWLAGDHDGERLVVVTRGAVAVTDTDDPDPDQGAVWGLVRSA